MTQICLNYEMITFVGTKSTVLRFYLHAIFRSNLGLPRTYNDWTLCTTQDAEDTKEVLVILFQERIRTGG